jgi:hypothetical protein
MGETLGFPTNSRVSWETWPNARTPSWGGRIRTSMAISKSDALACSKGATEPHFVRVDKPLETLEFREPY